MAVSKNRIPQRRGWLVRIDPEIWIDSRFARRLHRHARFAYFDSLFFLASADGPDGLYPASALRDEFGLDAEKFAKQLVDFGIWEDCGLGFTVRPYNGCRVVPECRAAIPRALRLAVYERDGHRCQICGATEQLSLDHIHPWSLAGPDTHENLRVLCRSCNSRKGARV